MNNDRRNLKNWARNCHYDGLIAIKEVKGKRWMAVLSWLEITFDFNIDDYNDFDESWKLILNAINSCTDDQIRHLDNKRYSL